MNFGVYTGRLRLSELGNFPGNHYMCGEQKISLEVLA